MTTTSEQIIAAGCADGDILMWDARHMAKTLARFHQSHDEDVTQLASMSSLGQKQTMLSCSVDNVMNMWDLPLR